jgi:hypothetical protein
MWVAVVDDTCQGCTWPYSPEAWTRWDRCRRPSFRITLDTGCVNARQMDTDLNQLEAWSRAGRISLQRSRVLLEELRGRRRIVKAKSLSPQPSLWVLGQSSLGSDEHAVLAARMPDETALATILFPTTTHLTAGHRRDVRHLQWHVHTGGHAFVTRDGDFLRHHSELHRVGIWVFSPAAAVAHVKRWLLE